MTLVRRCAIHNNIVETRNGVPFCPWGRGHYPEQWTSTDTKTGERRTEGAPSSPAEVKAWRSSIRMTLPTKSPAGINPANKSGIDAAPRAADREEASVPLKSLPSAGPLTPAPPPARVGKRRCGNCRRFGCRVDRCPYEPGKAPKSVETPTPADPPRAAAAPPPAVAPPRASERLVAFLYVLLRDQLPAGTVEKLYSDHVAIGGRIPRAYSNRYLEAYARELGERLTELA